MFTILLYLIEGIAGLVVLSLILSINRIGPTEVGLVTKRLGLKKLSEDNPIAFNGEAGYQSELLMPGLRFKLWPIFGVQKFPWVQVPAGEIGVVIAQVGKPLPIGAKSARYKNSFGNYSDLRSFITEGGEKGVQRPVLPPGTLVPIHPVAFLVITRLQVYGLPIDPGLSHMRHLTCESFGLSAEQLRLVRIEPQPLGDGTELIDMVGVVTTFEGDPLSGGDIASRLGGFEDILKMEEKENMNDLELIETLLGNKNRLHNNYQDFQTFLDNGGRIGLQHDTLLYGAYALNPFLISVELVPMLIVKQGQVAVIKAYVGLVTQDTSGVGFKYGSLVRPGHRGIWREPLRTGKYAINPRCYQAEIVPTAILTLNWAQVVSQAHNLDRQLNQITAKSQEGFIFHLDLQVQIHVPDTKAPMVISMVGTMQNLVNEVLQAAVGNHFRDKLQSMPAIDFIRTRQEVQKIAFQYISTQLNQYNVETKGVYIQDVILPEALVSVLTEREIANQEIETFKKQKSAQDQRVDMERAKGTADMQAELARSQVGIDIKKNNADAREAEGKGEAAFISQTGTAKGAEIRAIGLARAEAYAKQVDALGREATAAINIVASLSDSKTRLMPEILVLGGNTGAMDGLAGTLTQWLRAAKPVEPPPSQPPIVENPVIRDK